MAEEKDMLKAPKVRNEVNVNTLVNVLGFLIVIAGMGASWGQLTGRLDEHDRVVTRHGAQIENLRSEIGKIDNLTYRVTVTEQAQSELARSVEELKVLVNGQGTDLRVIREILGRVESKIDERR